eukprot:6718652-Pyramimonas_sp.AAC.1
MLVNPARGPHATDGSDRYSAAQCDAACAATHAENDALARQRVRNVLRTQPAAAAVPGRNA